MLDLKFRLVTDEVWKILKKFEKISKILKSYQFLLVQTWLQQRRPHSLYIRFLVACMNHLPIERLGPSPVVFVLSQSHQL